MNRADSLARWEWLASGQLSDDAPEDTRRAFYDWLTNVAQDIVKADATEKAQQRPGQIVRAVGLHGTPHRHPQILRMIREQLRRTTRPPDEAIVESVYELSIRDKLLVNTCYSQRKSNATNLIRKILRKETARGSKKSV